MNEQHDIGINSFSTVSVLLVDDNKVNQFLGKKILKNLGITNVDVASDGISALQMLQRKKFSVLLTDVEMPGMNGYELTTAVRSLKDNNKDITIIALTANATAEEKEYALKNGMNDYLSKPYSPGDLQDVLRKHVKRADIFMGVENHTENTETGNPVKALYALFNYNKEDVFTLLILLKTQLPENMQSLKDDILSDDYDSIFNSAHKLKSTIKLFNDDKLFSCICQITDNARSKNSIDQIPSLYDELNKGVSTILVLIAQEIESF
jgi:CheY-like chemotaxis protein